MKMNVAWKKKKKKKKTEQISRTNLMHLYGLLEKDGLS